MVSRVRQYIATFGSRIGRAIRATFSYLAHLKTTDLLLGSVLLVLIMSGLIVLHNRRSDQAGLALTSPQFANSGQLEANATCDGADINPAFEIKNIPAKAKSLAIFGQDTSLKTDKTKPNDYLWLVFNIPITATKITEGIRPPGTITRNYKGNFNYNGPCPDKGKAETVTFTLYALDKELLPINSSASAKDFTQAIADHTVGKSVLKATYSRSK